MGTNKQSTITILHTNDMHGNYMPFQTTAEIDYRPKGVLEGMGFRLQAVHKRAQQAESLTARDYLNKADMWNLTVRVDNRF